MGAKTIQETVHRPKVLNSLGSYAQVSGWKTAAGRNMHNF